MNFDFYNFLKNKRDSNLQFLFKYMKILNWNINYYFFKFWYFSKILCVIQTLDWTLSFKDNPPSVLFSTKQKRPSPSKCFRFGGSRRSSPGTKCRFRSRSAVAAGIPRWPFGWAPHRWAPDGRWQPDNIRENASPLKNVEKWEILTFFSLLWFCKHHATYKFLK